MEHVKKNRTKRDLEQEIDLLDTMVPSLVEILEQKGILTQVGWEKHIKQQIKIK